ncbi:MAG: ankyrin repeat domain-containing protein [Alphaproteobacteria bacterium]|nr:ankyrin repeat domain-containing protein [Alphaproteobacteria bacterium]
MAQESGKPGDGDIDLRDEARGMALFEKFRKIDTAFREGDLDALRVALGHPDTFPNCILHPELAMGEWPLGYAISVSPLAFVRELLAAGANANFDAHDGFPSLLCAIASDRADRAELVALLLENGADIGQRGVNDWTALHYATNLKDMDVIRILLEAGADPLARTNIDDRTTPLENAQNAGFSEGVNLMVEFMARGRG